MYYCYYIMMIAGFLGVSLQTSDCKMKLIGILLTIINAMLFWR